MSGSTSPGNQIAMPEPAKVERAIRFTYAQMMLNAVFGASTGGMFLIGFALKLGADNIILGLLSTIPAFFVVFQLAAAFLVERGISRKKLVVIFAFVSPFCWVLIAALPFFAPVLDITGRFAILIGVICLVSLAAQFAANARGSWVGELIPSERRGRFFGYCTMFAGIVGAGFAIAEGKFLDFIVEHGLFAFTALFLFGVIFGLASAALNIPQPDCPLPGGEARSTFLGHIRSAVRNRPFVRLAWIHAVLALSAIASPFFAAYQLRDLKMSYFALGLLNAVSTASLLLTSPLWGKLVDRFGSRPILILGLVMMAPCHTVWLLIPPGPGALHMAYMLLPWTNFVLGSGSGALGIAVSTMMYKTSRPEGRSVQFAGYSIFVSLVGAPMPLLGGWLVSHLASAGVAVDLRITFYLCACVIFVTALLARTLKEPESVGTRTLVFTYFPEHIVRLWGSVTSIAPVFISLMRLQLPIGRKRSD